jgi:transposase InsO family protein
MTSSTNWTASPPCVATRPCCAATTASNSRARRWLTGPANGSRCTSSHPANRGETAESFNARVRDECLNINIFWSLAQARVISDWKENYNHRRRHSALGYQPPAVYAAACTH